MNSQTTSLQRLAPPSDFRHVDSQAFRPRNSQAFRAVVEKAQAVDVLEDPVSWGPAPRRAQRRAQPTAALVMAVLAVSLLLTVVFGPRAAADSADLDGGPTITYVVNHGDTLWSIAQSVTPEGEDVRPLVEALKQQAGGASLQVGQRLALPATIDG